MHRNTGIDIQSNIRSTARAAFVIPLCYLKSMEIIYCDFCDCRASFMTDPTKTSPIYMCGWHSAYASNSLPIE